MTINVNSALSSRRTPASLQELKAPDLEILPDAADSTDKVLKFPVVEKFPPAEGIFQNAEGKRRVCINRGELWAK